MMDIEVNGERNDMQQFNVSVRKHISVLRSCFLQVCPESRLTDADLRVPDVPVGILEVERFTRLTVASHSVVQTVVANSSTNTARRQIHCHVKVALA